MPAITAITSIAALGYTVYSGERQAEVAKQGLFQQRLAQDKAEAAATSDARQAAEADKKASQKSPDLNVLLADQSPKASAATLDTNKLLLGRTSLLGV